MKPDTDFFLRVPQERGTGRSFGLAVLVHMLLMLILWYGVHWQNKPSSGVEVELLSEMPTMPNEHAPVSDSPAPAITPPPQPLFSMPSTEEQAEISLRLRDQQRLKQVGPLSADKGKEGGKVGGRESQSAVKSAPVKATAQQERQALLAQKEAKKPDLHRQYRKQDLSQKQQQVAHERLKQEMKAFEAQRTQQQIEKKREDRLAKLRDMTNKSDSTNRGTQASAKMGAHAGAGGEGGGPGYADRVRQRVKPNIVFDAETVAGNPQAVIEVECAPNGSILNVRLVQSSGNEVWDKAVLLAVEKSDPMPRGEGQQAPKQFTITFQPK